MLSETLKELKNSLNSTKRNREKILETLLKDEDLKKKSQHISYLLDIPYRDIISKGELLLLAEIEKLYLMFLDDNYKKVQFFESKNFLLEFLQDD